MGYAQFLAWVATMGWRVVGKQKYLFKVWKEATKGGKEVLKSHFPKLLSKAKNYYKNFIGANLKTVPKKTVAEGKKVRKQMEKVKIEPEIRTTPRPSSEIKAVNEGMKLKKGAVNIGKITQEDKYKAHPGFAHYIAQDTEVGYGKEYEDVGIPTLIRERARKFLK